MSKPHASLSPRTNALLIFAWAAAAAAFFFVLEPHAPLWLAPVGAALGAIGGVMQHLSLRQASAGFTGASSLLEVRAALKATAWGSRYIRFLYFCKILLAVLAFALVRQPLLAVVFAYLAAYFSLMFVREMVTFRDTIFLHRLSTMAPDAA
jgi:hypothetical protein